MITVETIYGKSNFEIREDSETDEIVIKEIFDENVYHIHDNMITDSCVIVDLGANIGAFTINMLLRAKNNGKSVKIIAVEPEPHNRAVLEKNIKLNEHLMGESKIIICDRAVGGQRGTVTISNEDGGARVGKEGTEVEMITLDDLFEEYNLKEVDLMKIDTEGSEVPTLLEVSDKNFDSVKRMVIEFDEYSGLKSFVKIIERFSRKCSFYTLGVPSRGCYLYTERHI